MRLPPAGLEESLSAIASAFGEKDRFFLRLAPGCGRRRPHADSRYVYSLPLPRGEIRLIKKPSTGAEMDL